MSPGKFIAAIGHTAKQLALAELTLATVMAVAYVIAHAPRGGWPIQNEGELAVLFCFVFLFVAARGSGIWSLDAWLQRRRPMAISHADGVSRA